MNDWINKVHCGDCLEVMKGIPDNSVDLVLTDPPYNASDIGPNKRKYIGTTMKLPEIEYNAFCLAWFKHAVRIGKRVVFTSGTVNVWKYPEAKWIICWHKPAAISFSRCGGFNAWEPILVYGKGGRIGQDYIYENTLNFSRGIEKEHPCPKPLKLISKLVKCFSKEDDIVLDPFLGSGTTAVACEKLKRRWIGIEISPEYCKIAETRIKEERKQLKLF